MYSMYVYPISTLAACISINVCIVCDRKLSTEPLRYEATILVSPTSNGQDMDISIIPPDPVASETRIEGYQLRITGDNSYVNVVNLSAQMRYVGVVIDLQYLSIYFKYVSASM